MARKLRLEAEGGIYHVLNRGNYRSHLFRTERARAAFLGCLDEACGKTGWRVHAWCVMVNHYHLALETPQANLREGMRWLQGTFAMRFNRFRDEHGHLFQGRYKSLAVEGDGLGALCHYIHLNPVRAKVCTVEGLRNWPWSSYHWLQNPRRRAHWYQGDAPLTHAGALRDTPAGRSRYAAYLAWLSEDEPGRKALHFDRMSKGWAIGSTAFKQALVAEHQVATATLPRRDRETEQIAGLIWEEALAGLLQQLGRQRAELALAGKSVPWKVALGAALKQRTTATNRWLAGNLHLGDPSEVSRKTNRWLRQPDPKLMRKLGLTPNPMT